MHQRWQKIAASKKIPTPAQGESVISKPGKFLPIFAALLLSAASCLAQSVKTHHVRQATKNGTAPLVGHLPSSQSMRIVLTLPLRNQEELDQFLQEVYDPNSPTYRHFLTVDEFTARFGPTQEDYDALIDFANEHGLNVVATSRNRLNLDVEGPVASIEGALHIKMGVYKHPEEQRNFFAPDREPTVNLPFQLWHVSGLDNFSIPRPAGLHKRSGPEPSATTGSGPSASFLGSDMRKAYYGGTNLTGTGQSVALLEFVGIDLADVNTYYANVHQTNTVPITVKSTDGTSKDCFASSNCDDTEQVLDVTQALGMAPGLSQLVVYVGSTDVSLLNAMATDSTLSGSIGCSWAWRPADPSTDDPIFQEFAAQGQNIFVAAGDSGKWPTRRSPYYFPADDDYVVSVGGTDLTTSSAGGPWSSESAWSNGGGGISPDSIPIPSWQVATANACSNCSKTIRNAPDVSANANYTFYVCANQTTCTANLYGGTSFAAPMWAGYLALVNQQAGTRVGFINPALYAIGNSSSFNTDFHDITSGSNGYSAVTGYDLATGWGSPNSGTSLIADIIAGGPGGGGGGTLDFSISASSPTLSVARGGTNTDTITITDSGGNSSVSLSASGQGKGVSISFSPSSLGSSGTSTMTVKANRPATTGTFTITITGTSASKSHSTQVTLTVN
jgi:kumamolisin